MRVIAGEFRSRRLQAPPGEGTRPTSDKLRETLFNVLGERTTDACFADLYAGSGAVGIEAISRGAAFCYFAERDPAALQALRANLASLGLTRGFTVNTRGAGPLLKQLGQEAHQRLDIVFLDPPYAAVAEYANTLEALGQSAGTLLAPGALVVAEHERKRVLPGRIGTLARTRTLEQGDSALSFFSVQRLTEPG